MTDTTSVLASLDADERMGLEYLRYTSPEPGEPALAPPTDLVISRLESRGLVVLDPSRKAVGLTVAGLDVADAARAGR